MDTNTQTPTGTPTAPTSGATPPTPPAPPAAPNPEPPVEPTPAPAPQPQGNPQPPKEPQEDKPSEGEAQNKSGILDLYNEDLKDDNSQDGAGDGKEGDNKDGTQPQVNDYDNYIFERDGVQATPEDAQIFKDVARELDLSQEKAQKLYSFSIEKITAINQQKLLAAQKKWEQAVYNDPELGGPNITQTSRNVKLALKNYGNSTFSKLMQVTGLGSHPAVVKMLNDVGAGIGNDQTFINGETRPKAQREPFSFYDNSPELK